ERAKPEQVRADSPPRRGSGSGALRTTHAGGHGSRSLHFSISFARFTLRFLFAGLFLYRVRPKLHGARNSHPIGVFGAGPENRLLTFLEYARVFPRQVIVALL